MPKKHSNIKNQPKQPDAEGKMKPRRHGTRDFVTWTAPAETDPLPEQQAAKNLTRKPTASAGAAEAPKPSARRARRTKSSSNGEAASAAPAAEAPIAIDHPSEGEVVAHPTYAFRMTAAAGSTLVEARVDGGPWLLCREALGFWWFDWSGYSSGPHELSARVQGSGEEWTVTAPRRFSVSLPG